MEILQFPVGRDEQQSWVLDGLLHSTRAALLTLLLCIVLPPNRAAARMRAWTRRTLSRTILRLWLLERRLMIRERLVFPLAVAHLVVVAAANRQAGGSQKDNNHKTQVCGSKLKAPSSISVSKFKNRVVLSCLL